MALPLYDPWPWHMCTQVVCTTLPREALEPMIGPMEVGFLVAHLFPLALTFIRNIKLPGSEHRQYTTRGLGICAPKPL